MVVKIDSEEIFFKDYGWHSGYFHFAFGDYHDPDNKDFGVLSALNDFTVQPESGFETHPHSEMEIISYCVHGSLVHKDSTGKEEQLVRGDSQYTCTGSGITHSEMNGKAKDPLRFLQIWIKPKVSGLQPLYKIKKFQFKEENENLRHLISGDKLEGVMQIEQDANVFAGHLGQGQSLTYKNNSDRQSYIYCLEGKLSANGINLAGYDAMKIWGSETVSFDAPEHAHFLIVEMSSV